MSLIVAKWRNVSEHRPFRKANIEWNTSLVINPLQEATANPSFVKREVIGIPPILLPHSIEKVKETLAQAALLCRSNPTAELREKDNKCGKQLEMLE